MSMTRTLAFASLTAIFAGAVPPAALAGEMPRLTPSLPAGADTPPPVPSSAAVEASWYVVVDGQAVGPLSDADLVSRIKRGRLPGDVLVWRSGMQAWVPADQQLALVAKRIEAGLKKPRFPEPKGNKFRYIDAAFRP